VESEASLSDILKEMDTNKDGKITFEELAAGERKLREQGIGLSLSEDVGLTMENETEHHAKLEHTLGSLGPGGHLEGRLDPNILKS